MCVYIKRQNGFILCLHSLFNCHFKTDLCFDVRGVKGVEIYSICEILYYEKDQMLCMSKVSKVAQYTQ